MKCPLCKSERLVLTRYESVAVKTCPSCEGYLLRRNRLPAIKNSREKKAEDFQNELASPSAVDNTRVLHCPSCLGRMAKNRNKIGLQEYFTDACTKCDYVWFDAGELAKLQLQYEESDQGKEMFRFRDRLDQMTDAERAELDERIAKLKNAPLLDREDYLLLAYLLLR